ncbi:hypothetical protein EVAR_102252_1 [Eumeta japonica]|uniref:Uncharacterized protein n=1 Tax=Eumeta variegata TaxID=151549 RepID=A0A4C1WFZ0_EUMVA|nr:hypothetical protein EVAR_102252_1 [Eumeta japonica]
MVVVNDRARGFRGLVLFLCNDPVAATITRRKRERDGYTALCKHPAQRRVGGCQMTAYSRRRNSNTISLLTGLALRLEGIYQWPMLSHGLRARTARSVYLILLLAKRPYAVSVLLSVCGL